MAWSRRNAARLTGGALLAGVPDAARLMRGVLLAGLLSAGAQAEPAVPLPPARPDRAMPGEADPAPSAAPGQDAPSEVLAGTESPPLPPSRPDRPALSGDGPAGSPELSAGSSPPLPPPRPDGAAPPESAAAVAEAPELEDRDCPDRLARLGVRYEPRPTIRDDACGVQDPVLVSALSDGLEVAPPALMTCPMAEGLALWARDTVIAEAESRLQSAPTKILIGTAYECRNQRSGAKLSEHAFGNGVDVMGFAFAKRGPVTIGGHPDGSPEGAFQASVQKGACPFFTTVLGPGSDAAHGDHLHLDQRGRRGGYRICQ